MSNPVVSVPFRGDDQPVLIEILDAEVAPAMPRRDLRYLTEQEFWYLGRYDERSRKKR